MILSMLSYVYGCGEMLAKPVRASERIYAAETKGQILDSCYYGWK